MLRKLLVAVVMMVAMLGLNPSNAAQATQPEKVRICHRTASVVNPYNSIEVSLSAVDGEGNNDHSHHTGPVFDPTVHQQGDTWGDIIPPVPGVTDGLNWPAGEETWKSDCVPSTGGEQPNIVFEVVCTEVREETVVQVTFTNFGDVSGSAFLNEEEVVVGSGQTVIEYVELDTEVVIEIDEQIVYDATPECEEPEEDGEVLAEEDTPKGAVDAGAGGVALLGLIASVATLATGAALVRKQTQ
ncbi:MAG TPA: hypothetical protein VGA08_01860 [Candidatus Saccharimonadales bacterium]